MKEKEGRIRSLRKMTQSSPRSKMRALATLMMRLTSQKLMKSPQVSRVKAKAKVFHGTSWRKKHMMRIDKLQPEEIRTLTREAMSSRIRIEEEDEHTDKFVTN
jgi:hypothetical protein